MTTILDAEFGSDDEDSDYVLSETSSDSDDDEKSERKLKREEKKRREREKLLQRVNDMFTDMLRQSDVSYKHPESRDKDDFMLQFHKKAPPESKISSVKQFESYLDKSSSRVFPENLQLDIRDFKSRCHQTPNAEKLEMIKNAVAVKDADPVTVKTTYKFAGTTYEVMDKVDKTSRKYSNYLKVLFFPFSPFFSKRRRSLAATSAFWMTFTPNSALLPLSLLFLSLVSTGTSIRTTTTWNPVLSATTTISRSRLFWSAPLGTSMSASSGLDVSSDSTNLITFFYSSANFALLPYTFEP
nr:cytochrome c oxidase copper chaperone, Dopuin [Theileria orientalis]